ncbi:MAG: hypothetical protein A3I07_02740 [Candidatus Doudnabacteria bacterium RIFCSPLOWO2_02_FULL_42_9]|uniref:Uncharacterized protein n=1 Tax=Candidatus Doudnabacteria bacterium RIFCSPHIGHO2_01_FULL_41_86 TaxID=1817821 RepID=A0A1F5N9R9_9BACT|nr:MAG: hypothetical protein A2717_02270 [Candidatus Doudnabacteria bacterium RIFCSPHIGHO2_01_FULL_41_86]OGE75587.1 MAG: hypothetical protein A3K07_02025 [Candidatus Doudnabacteria bacterium RIFCSPHIGHO2_01_43_10]OGE85383.1 MAG: hypothetical protein A3E28_01840 [Candidatus Doudnabacteria bacterium RIFCSPHIGHO2_12_FULL_42_22]OGE86921.1 MAG: hypothetical protein A3C49_02675 [Candidatus Doudnabacteria bacterium RIFCSPHIGHO2_02_FULL_42_25]OGE92520.1 MAG: hypothetical protein A2895_02830 [Candidatus
MSNITEKKNKVGLLRLSEDEIRIQVDKYNDLKFRQSYRGISVILLILSLIITLIGFLRGSIDVMTAGLALVIYLPLAYFIFKGKKAAMIIALVIITLDKAYQISQVPNPFILVWWAIFAIYLSRSYLVEKSRETRALSLD